MNKRSDGRQLSSFAQLLRRVRCQRGLTQARLAQQVSCALDTIKKLETDARRPSRQMAVRLADVFSLTSTERAAFFDAARNVGNLLDPPVADQAAPPQVATVPRIAMRGVLPPQYTSFIGRENELNTLTALLADPACRLVTVTGPGGIGKTRIAIELATRLLVGDAPHLASFADGVWFVALQAVDSSERLVLAIADAIKCPPPGAADVRDYLLAYLQPRHLLLLLDNFEHLQRWPDLLQAILAAAPKVKLLVTSREALNLEQEWRYPLNGLPLEAEDDVGVEAWSSAAALFVERARRVHPAFNPAAERDAVLRICRLVEGIPLAIELAATWTRVLSCTAIAQEIVGDLTFLTSNMRDVPNRHRSMQVVFDRTWELLNRAEQQVFACLCIFRAGFQRDAALQVAGATLPVLTALVDKSLLRREADERYRLHELLRQYAAERLEESGAEAAAVRARHCTYYTGYLGRRAADLRGGRQRQALAEIAAELENVRAAWQYAAQHRRIADLLAAAYPLYVFFDYSSRCLEGFELFEPAVQQIDHLLGNRPATREVGPILSELLLCLGWHSIRLGELERARDLLTRSQAILTQLAIAPRPDAGTDPLVALGTVANVLGDYAEAARLGEEARRRGEARDDPWNVMYAYFVLTNAALQRGRYAEATDYGERACRLAEQVQDHWFMAYLVADLGNIARANGDYAQAVRHYQTSYAIRDEFDDPEGIAVALVNLGQVSLLQGDSKTAQAQFQRSLAIYRDIANRGGEATSLHGLGMVAIAEGAYSLAAQYLLDALQISTAIGYASRTHAIQAEVAELFLHLGAPLQAAGLLVAILRNPASNRETCDHARRLLSRCTDLLSPDQYASVTRGRQALDLPTLFAMLRRAAGLTDTLVAEATENAVLPPPGRRKSVASAEQPLPESLTPQELAVLHLIATGQSNQAIAAQLVITLGTAKWYVGQILRKLGVHSRTEAVARGHKLGLLK